MAPPPACDEALRIRMAEVASRQRALWLAEEFVPSYGPLSKFDDRTVPVLIAGQSRKRFVDSLMLVGAKLFSY
eukprot:13032300-Alexandrium_andersonii.AAC.1